MLAKKNISSNFDLESQFEEFKKKKFFFIVSAGRSGKALFSGLVDSNKKILIMHFSNKILSEINYIIKIDKEKISGYIANKSFLKKIKHFDKDKKEKFKNIFDYLINKNNLEQANVYYLVYFCYAKVFNFDIKNIEVIFLDSPYLDNFLIVEKYFKNPNFIYLARNPYDLFLSLKTLYFDDYSNTNNINTVVRNINLYSLENIRRSLTFFDKKRNHLVIKYEDMYKKTKFFFKKLSEFISTEIYYTEQLTFFNSPKISNSSFYSHTSSINHEIDEFRYKKLLLKKEIYLINIVLGKYFDIIEYKIDNIKLSKFKLILSFFSLFKGEFLPNKKIFKIKNNNMFKNLKIYMLSKYIFYFFINLIFYPINLFHVIKLILNNRND